MKLINQKLKIFILALFLNFGISIFNAIAFVPNDPLYSNQWYLKSINAENAWEFTKGSEDVVVAVIDTGVDIDNPDLKDNIFINKDEIPGNGKDDDNNGFIDDVYGWDFVDNDNDPNPNFNEPYSQTGISHGTVIAGIISAKGNNNQGIAGISFNSKIMPIRAINSLGEGELGIIKKGIRYAIDNGADIINLSFITSFKDKELLSLLKEAYKKGILIVSAAGNDSFGEIDLIGGNLDLNPKYPVCLDIFDDNFIIGVAGLNRYDEKTSFSNYGTYCIDISAPAEDIISTQVYNPEKGGIFKGKWSGYWSGTSFAAPIIAGSLALGKSINKNLSGNKIISVLKATADKTIYQKNLIHLGMLGAGKIDLGKFIKALSPISNKSTKNIKKSTIKQLVGSKKSNIYIQAIINEKYGFVFLKFDLNGKLLDSFDIWKGKKRPKTLNFVLNSDYLIVAPQANFQPEVRVYSFEGELISDFFAYDKNFKGGINLGLGDIDYDGKQEIITAANHPGGPHIRIFDINGNYKYGFFAYDKNLRGGVDIAIADIDYDGNPEIIAMPQKNYEKKLKIFKYKNGKFLITSFSLEFLDTKTNWIIKSNSDRNSFLVYPNRERIKNAYIIDFNGKIIKKLSVVYSKNKWISLKIKENYIFLSQGLETQPQIRIYDINSGFIKNFFFSNPNLRTFISLEE